MAHYESDWPMDDCKECNCTGTVECPFCYGKGSKNGHTCSSCSGTGMMKCENCDGRGYVKK